MGRGGKRERGKKKGKCGKNISFRVKSRSPSRHDDPLDVCLTPLFFPFFFMFYSCFTLMKTKKGKKG